MVHRNVFMLAVLIAVAALAIQAAPAAAQEADKALLDRIEQEKAARRSCKVQICDIARNRKAEGTDVACTVTKTWTVGELKDNVLKGKFDWPLGHAQCKAEIKLDRKMLSLAIAGGPVEAKLVKHTVSCALDQKAGGDPYTLSFAIQPTVSFAGGKAVKASLNWSDIQGSAVARGAVWSAAALDNNLGMFESATVDAINNFFGGQCDEVKDELGK